jgi:hypothetical protein
MGQWFTDLIKPFEPYEHQLNIVAALAVIFGFSLVGIISAFFKPVRSAVASLWSRLLRATRRTARIERADLRFVALASQSFIAAIQGDNEKANAEVFSNWTVFNASTSGPPIRILRVYLARPRVNAAYVHDMVFVTRRRGDRSEFIGIGPGDTCRLDFRILFVLPAKQLKELKRVRIVAVDQLANEHLLPEIEPRIVTQTANATSPQSASQNTKIIKVRISVPPEIWETIVEFSGDMAQGNSEERLRDLAGSASIEVITQRWMQKNPGRSDIPHFTQSVQTQPLRDFNVSNIMGGIGPVQLTVGLRVWMTVGPPDFLR